MGELTTSLTIMMTNIVFNTPLVMQLSLQIQIPHWSGRDSAISLQSQVQTARCREGDNNDNNNVPADPCIRANAGKAARDHS